MQYIPSLLKSYAVCYIGINGNYRHTSVLLARVHRPMELPVKLLSLLHMDIIKDLLMHHVCLPEKITHTNTKPKHVYFRSSSRISVFYVVCTDLYSVAWGAVNNCSEVYIVQFSFTSNHIRNMTDRNFIVEPFLSL